MQRPYILILPVLLFLGGCTHYLSEQSRAVVDRTVTFGQLQENPDAFRGKLVMLGGIIATVTYGRDGTRLEVVEHRLDSRELPDETNPTRGRFLATTPDTLDPDKYQPGTLVSLMGVVVGKKGESLQGADYTYPVIAIKEIHDIVFEEMPDWGGPFGGM